MRGGGAKGFYWNDYLEEVGNHLVKEKGEEEEDVIDALCGLIKYKVKKLEHLQNISDNKKEFRETLTAKGIPDAICDLLFEKYVVEATVREALGHRPFLADVKVVLEPSKSEEEVFRALFGMIKYGIHTENDLKEISDNKKEFTEKLSAKGVPDAICDLLFEKYVATKTTAWEWLAAPEPMAAPEPVTEGPRKSPKLNDTQNLSSSKTGTTCVPIHYRPDFLEEWVDFITEVPEELQQKPPSTPPMYSTWPSIVLNSEVGGIQPFLLNLGHDVSKAASECFSPHKYTARCNPYVHDTLKKVPRYKDISISRGGPLTDLTELLIIEAKRPSAFRYDTLKAGWEKAIESRGEKQIDNGMIRCGVTQLCMYLQLSRCRIGALCTIDNTWFVCLVEKDGKYGIKATKGFRLQQRDTDGNLLEQYRDTNPGNLSLAQAVMLAVVKSVKIAEEKFSWKALPEGQDITKGDIDDLGLDTSANADVIGVKDTNTGLRRSQSTKSRGSQGNLPMEHVSVKLDMSDDKVVPVLGGTGLGFRKQLVHGYTCFIKTICPEYAGIEPMEELMHEARIYKLLQPVWGEAVPSVIFHGKLDDGKFALMTTDSGESIAHDQIEREDQGRVRKHAHDALRLVHSNGILHGDVALRNFVVDDQCNVKVIDFGRAEQVDPNEPKVQESFIREHRELDSEFNARGFDTSLHYDEKRDSFLSKKRSASAIASYGSSTDDDSMSI